MKRGSKWLLIAGLVCSAHALAQDELGPPAGANTIEQAETGNLAIRAVQGTADAPTPAGNKVEVHLFHRGQVFKQLDTTLDDMGLVVLSDLPVGMGIQPVVRIEHAGVTYQETGPEMTVAAPDASIDVVVYETTTDRPAWRVVERFAIVTLADERLLITESIKIDNPNDKTWLGTEQASNSKLTTVEVNLPEHSQNVTLVGGFHGWCCTTFEESTLAIQMPLMPEQYIYEYTYEVPTVEGIGQLSFGARAITDKLAVVVPETGMSVEPDGLNPGSVQMTETGPQRLYFGDGIASDQTATIKLIGLNQTASTSGVSSAPGGSLNVMWFIGGGVVLLGAIAVGIALRRGGG